MDDVAQSEEFPDSFLCCVCLDLLYKPIVLSCGHICCFWCVHNSMGLFKSHCPICRHPYNHFPTICQMLHFILFKMYPIAYKRREEQVLEEEKKMGHFSPQLDYNECGSHADQEYDHLKELPPSSSASLVSNSHLHPCFIRKRETYASMEQTDSVSIIEDSEMSITKEFSDENCGVLKTVSVEEKNLPQNKPHGNGNCVLIADVQCVACKQLLFHPVVLNCGHVYCETCVIGPMETLKCQVCKSLHPRGFPKVCLELDHFLEEQFPKEYALRKDVIQLREVRVKNQTTRSTKANENNFKPHLKVHIGVGCDSCGILPIIGDRYKCKDCVEEIGFDLCGDCYNTHSKLPGRFNQQHTPEHKFELVEPNIRFEMLRLVTGRLEDFSTIANYDNAASGLSENEFPAPTLSSDAQESTGNGLVAAGTHAESSEDENETQSTN